MKSRKFVALVSIGVCSLLFDCSTQESATQQEFQFFTPLKKLERRSGPNEGQTKTPEPASMMKDIAVDSLKREVEDLRQMTSKLERIIVPNDPIVLERGKNIILEGVTFQGSSARLASQSETILRKALVALIMNPQIKVEIAGYTDDRENPEVNLTLSEQRARSVKDWLVSSGIEAERLTAVGKGIADPVVPNTSAEGRARNRRIEFHVSN